MKKKSLILLCAVCILSLIFLSGLIVFAFETQKNRDERAGLHNPDSATAQVTPSVNGPTATVGADDSAADTDNSASEPDSDGTGVVSSETDSTNSEAITNPVDPKTDAQEETETAQEQTTPIVLGFAGDVNFDEDSKPVAKYDSEQKGILGGLSSDLVEEMKAADIMMLNNEFAYSKRGTEIKEKSYTFRADPSRVNILHEMGVDIVSLANNHALDFGQEALLDTFTTLDDDKIDYIGAGENMDRAKAPIYYTLGDKKIAYLAASRVIYAMDWYATDTRPGMIGTYDPALLIEGIKEAAKNSDYVVVYVHWGVERTNYPEKYQKTMAKQYIDAGADVVIGCHPHVLQGIEFYKGKPIAYSLGNFWFNNTSIESAMLKVYLDPDGTMRTQLLPVMAEGTYSYILQKETKRKSYFEFMEEISYDITIDSDGFITEKH
jgi:poly-gamma-glutamate synthesis protein (capsule biosynthesis protein)